MNQRSVGLFQLACGWEYYAETGVVLLSLIAEAMGPCTGSTHVQQEQGRVLNERVRLLVQGAAGLLPLAGYQRERLGLQNTAVCLFSVMAGASS